MPRDKLITIDKLKTSLKEEQRPQQNQKCDKMQNSFTMFLVYLLEPILPGDGNKTDGKIASVVYLICLTTAGIVMNIASWLHNDGTVTGVTRDHIDGFLMTCICPALIWILYIFCKQNDRKTVDFISPMPHSHRPLMTGAYVFGAGSCAMDVLHIGFYMQCSESLSGMAFSVFKAVFIIAQILFLRKFSDATLHKSQNIRLVLFHILGTNVCLWFRALFSHVRLINKSSFQFNPLNQTVTCDNQKTPMSQIWLASEPYLYPFTMEYSLISGGILFMMWSGLRDLNPDPQDIYIYDEISEWNTSEAGDFKDDSSGYIGSSTPSTSWSRSQSHASLSTASVCKSCQETREAIRDSYTSSSDPGFLFGVLLSAFLLFAIALLMLDHGSEHALRFYYVYQIMLHAVMVTALWTFLKALQTQLPAWYSYDSDDTLLIVSFTGVFLYAGLGFTSAISEMKAMSSLSNYVAAKSVLVLFESMLQVTAIIKALRFKPNVNGSYADMIRQCALFLLTTNIALWAQDSFFEMRSSLTTPVQNKQFGSTSWRAITVFAYPLCIFFRFHSAACLFEVWSNFKQCCS
ncbi:proton channel OtopLc-like [Rhopilema esculentum]|uniref:proton channel OtopLc-like n=1 Tax=Rhopilema esculentum TaxID=499914 RepID=UPI0031D58762|eukprot:gene4106-20288_t